MEYDCVCHAFLDSWPSMLSNPRQAKHARGRATLFLNVRIGTGVAGFLKLAHDILTVSISRTLSSFEDLRRRSALFWDFACSVLLLCAALHEDSQVRHDGIASCSLVDIID